MHSNISGSLNAAKYLDTFRRGSDSGAAGALAGSAMAVTTAHFHGVWKEFRSVRCENLRSGDDCVGFCPSPPSFAALQVMA
jgi:hypothetical protein